MVNLFGLLPNNIIEKISEYTDRQTKNELSLVDRRTNAVVLGTKRCLNAFPSNFQNLSQCHPSNFPEDVLVKVIRRHSSLKMITFGSVEFRVIELPYIQSLISYLENDHEKTLLSSIKKIKCGEITYDYLRGFELAHAKDLKKRFFSAIGNKGLENIRINVCRNDSITGTDIQPVLINSPNLKTFVFYGTQSDQFVSLSFASQPHLSKVKLLYWKGLHSTIESLRNCKELEELVIDCRLDNSENIKAILLEPHPWNLKRLELEGIDPQNDSELDAITQKLPKLECLSINLESISDSGMELLGRNCPNLKILQFNNKNLTDSGLSRLTTHLPHLEIISVDVAYKITQDGIAALARNCKNLKFVQIANGKKIGTSGFDPLVKNCLNLKVLGFSYFGPASLEAMYRMAEQIPNLRYIQLYSMREIPKGQIEEFYQHFPHIKEIPFISSAKKLQSLTI